MGAVQVRQEEGSKVQFNDDDTKTYFFGSIGVKEIEEVVENVEENINEDEDDIKSDEMLMMIKMFDVVKEMNKKIEKIEEKQDEKEMINMIGDTVERSRKIDQKMSMIDKKMNRIEKKFDEIKGRTKMFDMIEYIEKEVEKINEKSYVCSMAGSSRSRNYRSFCSGCRWQD